MYIKKQELYFSRPMDLFTKEKDRIILHHTGTIVEQNIDVIHNYHKSLGWCGIGYHYYIRKDGTIYKGRDTRYIGCHCTGYNRVSIGVCCEGNFDKEEMTQEQFNSLVELVIYLMKQFNIKKIFKHNELNETTCCGKLFPIGRLLGKIQLSNYKEDKEMVKWLKTTTAYYNVQGLHVTILQCYLKHLGLYNDTVDGHFGKNTKKAVQQYQKNNGLAVDGSVGIKTWTKILEV